MKDYHWNLCAVYVIMQAWLVSPVSHVKRNDSEDASRTTKSARISGHVVLGGLFPVHKKSEDPSTPCGEIQEERGIQRLEAMLFTIDKINNDQKLLPGIRLGANIFDTCSRGTYALEQALEYVRASMSTLDASEFKCADGSKAIARNTPIPVVAVIGGSYSSVSIQVANLLRLFKIPQVSYASTTAALSDKTRFEYFARTVPPDTFQAKAMVDILQHFNWTYVSTVSSEGDYGEKGIYSFKQEARARNICVAVAEKISSSSTSKEIDDVIILLLKKTSARVVILFLRVEDARKLLLAAKRRNVTDHFVWVASDGWGKGEMPVKGNHFVAEGALTIELQSIPLPEFDKYFKSLNPFTNTRNPWFKTFWEKVHNCKMPSDTGNYTGRVCTGVEKFTPRTYQQETKIQFIYDAILAMAKALHSMFSELCKNQMDWKPCVENTQIDGEVLKRHLLNVSFDDGYGARVQFDERGDGLGRYNILNYRRNRETRKYEYVTVGTWTNVLKMIATERVVWAGGTYDLPDSQCSKPCGQGKIKHMQRDSCCWICTPCQPWEYVKDEFTCKDCGAGRWPWPDKKSCFQLAELYMKWDSVYAIVPMFLSCAGIALTLIVMLTFIKHNNTPVVKASGRELSFMLLIGFLICYLMSFVLLARPTSIICSVQRFGVGFGFSLTYASLLTKTNRISRIFDSASRSAKRPAFISPKSQVVITCILISIQVVVTCIWLILEPPGVRHYFPNGRRDSVILKCKIQDISFLISLIYNMLLIIICTVYAVKTRKIPENFNESKFIGFTMYTTCIIWLAFVPIYFGTLNSFQIQITTLCVSISLSASVALLCLFAPKMYIIVFQPEKNVRKLTMNSAQYKKAATSSMSCATGNHGTSSEHIKLHVHGSMRLAGGATTETETDRDSLASL